MKEGRWNFSQTFSKQAAPISVLTTYNYNTKSHGINICNALHCFYFLIRKFSTKKYSKFEHTSKLVVKFWPFVLFIVDFNQPFNSCNMKSKNHKDGSILNYQLLFTKPRASNVFDQHYCRATNTIHFNQLHALCKKLWIKWQCLCIITTQPICNY